MTITPVFIFNLFIVIITINFLINKLLDSLNSRHFNDPIPTELNDVYDEDDYIKSQAYKKENFRFSSIISTVTFFLTLLFFYLEGFAIVDKIARGISDNEIIIVLLFFGIIMLASDLLTTPLAYYKTFVIEEKYGFNKTSKKLFFLDNLISKF